MYYPDGWAPYGGIETFHTAEEAHRAREQKLQMGFVAVHVWSVTTTMITR